MIKFENTGTMGWEGAIRGMRNPMNSWEKSDSFWCVDRHAYPICYDDDVFGRTPKFVIGPNDLDLARRLAKGGPVHAKYRRQIFVSVDITAPLYWWKEFDTYKVGTTANSCSTMHKIHAKEFTREDFSCETLFDDTPRRYESDDCFYSTVLDFTIKALNDAREMYLRTKDKKYWKVMIELLPSSYNQKRTITMDYENLYSMFKYRKDHKLDEWSVEFCEWAKSLPYSELFTMEWEEEKT